MFEYKSLDEIIEKSRGLGYELPHSDDMSVLARRVKISEKIILKNALVVHPMEGFDGEFSGEPSELTFRRYRRFAEGGAGLIWFEATSVTEDGRTCPRQLWINRENIDGFKRIAEEIHKISDGAAVIMQLTHSGRQSAPHGKPEPVIAYHNPVMNTKFNIDPSYPVVSDEYLDALREKFYEAAQLAYEAGFDGVDVKACHRYLMSELLSAYTREGKYGGSYENRTRLFKDVISDIKSGIADKTGFIIGSRFASYDGIDYPYGFGVNHEDYRIPDTTEPIQLLKEANQLGVSLVNITMGTPYYNPHVNRPYSDGGYVPPEEPIEGVIRLISGVEQLKKAVTEITFVGTGYTYLRGFAPNVAAGAVETGKTDIVGFGRMAFAYPDFARDILNGAFDAKKVCMTCGKCTEIMRAGKTTGCPVRDKLYTEIYQSLKN